MVWGDIEIESVAVDLHRARVSINNDSIILSVSKGRVRAIQVVYAIAFATKYSPMDSTIRGLTWAWLKETLQRHSGARALSTGNTARTVWNQYCLEPDTWFVSGRGCSPEDWLRDGRTLLRRLFISEPLTTEQKHRLKIDRRMNRLFLPESAAIGLVPDNGNMPGILSSVTPSAECASSFSGSRVAPTDTGNEWADEDRCDQRKRYAVAGNPPLPPELLVGRDEDMRNLRADLGVGEGCGVHGGRPRTVVMRGWPGVGKSTVAAALANDIDVQKEFRDGILWASLGQAPNIFGELSNLADVVGCPYAHKFNETSQLTRHLMNMLCDKRLLLVLDDVWEASHVTPFRVGGPLGAVLVTTRLPGVAQALSLRPDDMYVLNQLSDRASIQLFELLAPTVLRGHREQCLDLIRELEGLPLALRVAGGILNAEMAHGWGVGDLLAELKNGTARLLESDVPIDMAELLDQTTPNVAALLRRSVERLEGNLVTCFAQLGSFAPKPATFDLDAMSFVWEVNDPKPIVRELVSRGLLEPVGGGRFQMHALLVSLARSLLSE